MSKLEPSLPGEHDRLTIELAKGGDRDAAIELIRRAVVGLYARSLSHEVADYLALALSKVLPNGTGFDAAFNLERKPGRPSDGRASERDQMAAVWVYCAVRHCGLTETDAKARAADAFGLENIDRALRQAKPDAEALDMAFASASREPRGEAWFTEMFKQMGKPLPPRLHPRKHKP